MTKPRPRCPRCGKTLQKSTLYLYCPECGDVYRNNPYPKVCPHCGAKIYTTGRPVKCPVCGQPWNRNPIIMDEQKKPTKEQLKGWSTMPDPITDGVTKECRRKMWERGMVV